MLRLSKLPQQNHPMAHTWKTTWANYSDLNWGHPPTRFHFNLRGHFHLLHWRLQRAAARCCGRLCRASAYLGQHPQRWSGNQRFETKKRKCRPRQYRFYRYCLFWHGWRCLKILKFILCHLDELKYGGIVFTCFLINIVYSHKRIVSNVDRNVIWIGHKV